MQNFGPKMQFFGPKPPFFRVVRTRLNGIISPPYPEATLDNFGFPVGGRLAARRAVFRPPGQILAFFGIFGHFWYPHGGIIISTVRSPIPYPYPEIRPYTSTSSTTVLHSSLTWYYSRFVPNKKPHVVATCGPIH